MVDQRFYQSGQVVGSNVGGLPISSDAVAAHALRRLRHRLPRRRRRRRHGGHYRRGLSGVEAVCGLAGGYGAPVVIEAVGTRTAYDPAVGVVPLSSAAG
ncbi:MAG TPA: hypothetical protein VFG35_19475 [Actinoplanes sp.]|nr:hypothetical protein [Actinoplanes sp.]